MGTLLLAVVLFICMLTACHGNIRTIKTKSQRANEQCMHRKDFRARQEDLLSSRPSTTVQLPLRSVRRGEYTPWIVYRGCYQISTLSTNQPRDDMMINNNTVGKCYWECKLQTMRNNSCGNNTDVLFGLFESHCVCYCKAPDLVNLEESNNCNVTCSPSSFEDGECGGQNHFSAYAEYKPEELPLAGYCLICSNINSIIDVCGIECDEIATGVCVSDDSLNSIVHFNGTMNSYWDNCKMKNKFITGHTSRVCQNAATWTGIRKYKIDADDYQITTTSAAEGPSYTPNNKILLAMVVLIITILTAFSLGCLIWYFQIRCKRRTQQPHNCLTTVENITYADIIIRSESDQRQNNVTCSNQTKIYENQRSLSSETKHIFAQKDDGEYDCLHSSRQRQGSLLEENRYGDASCLGDSYSTAGQVRKPSLILDDQYVSRILLPGYRGNSCNSAENINNDHIYQLQSDRDTDCHIYKGTNVNIP